MGGNKEPERGRAKLAEEGAGIALGEAGEIAEDSIGHQLRAVWGCVEWGGGEDVRVCGVWEVRL